MNIVISSGKGGTGKTLVATNIAVTLEKMGRRVTYLDCDVEAPNGHLFLKPDFSSQEEITIRIPVAIDQDKCTACGRCSEACAYNAIAVIKDKVLLFPELCHACGACQIVCPVDAIVEEEKKIGTSAHGKRGQMEFHNAILETAAGGMSPRLVREVKKNAGQGINILDSSPGTACPVAEAIRDADLVVLVTDPTPFGINDLKLAANMSRKIGIEPVVLINRAGLDEEKLREYCSTAKLKILAEIPDDRRIAEVYSVGDLIVERLPEYRDLFLQIAEKVEKEGRTQREVIEPVSEDMEGEGTKAVNLTQARAESGAAPRELVIISGKGGTGKTSIAAAFATLASGSTMADCDVDAPDLHLILHPRILESGSFSGGVVATIDENKCTGCSVCARECRFDAIKPVERNGKRIYSVDPIACEGCGVCKLVCRFDAVTVRDSINGRWFLSETRFGPMAHAQLGIAEENSGRLVTLVRQKAAEIPQADGRILIDGAPGTGCPVIASITGARYALIVTEPTVSGIHDMIRVLEVTKYFRVPSGVLVNKYDLNPDMVERIQTAALQQGSEVLGRVPFDKIVTQAQMQAQSVVEYDPESEVSKEIAKVWQRIRSMF